VNDFLTALAIGLASGVAPGPMLVLVVSTSLRHGLAAGIRIALAPLLSDLPIVAVVFGLYAWIQANTHWIGVLAVVGAFYLAWFGWRELRGSHSGLENGEARSVSLRQAVTLNLLNPHPWMFWIGVGGPIVFRKAEQGPGGAFTFVSGFYLALIGAKLCIAWFVANSRTGLRDTVYRRILNIAAGVLLVFAVILFWDGIRLILAR